MKPTINMVGIDIAKRVLHHDANAFPPREGIDVSFGPPVIPENAIAITQLDSPDCAERKRDENLWQPSRESQDHGRGVSR